MEKNDGHWNIEGSQIKFSLREIYNYTVQTIVENDGS